MPVLRSANSFAGIGAQNHPHHLATRGLGPLHGRTPQKGPRRLHSPTYSGGQIHQVDRGEAITNIRSEEAVKFFLNIICRFGVPNCIITDHGTNFTGKKFLDFCDGYGIRIDWASVGHPCTNGQVEHANDIVL